MTTIPVDFNNVTRDGLLKVDLARVPVGHRGSRVVLHDRMEDVRIAGTVHDVSGSTVYFQVDWDALDASNHIVATSQRYLSVRVSAGSQISSGHLATGHGLLVPA